MGTRLGIICGAGDFPFFVCEEANKRGNICVIAAVKGFANPSLEDRADIFRWFGLDDIFALVSFFKENDVHEALFAGKIDPRVIYAKENLPSDAVAMMEKGKDKSPTSLLNMAIGFLGSQGITVIDPSPFLGSAFCEAGFLTEIKNPGGLEVDIEYGWTVARQIADLDIGQTVVVKDKAIVAVEGMEGTDEAIKRGGLLAGDGTTVVKVSRTHQDPRVDLPAVGLDTVQSLIEAKSAVLCVEANRVAFFQKEEAIALADSH
ncbi:LpxI family protein, partial [Acidobacteriota bacterium]